MQPYSSVPEHRKIGDSKWYLHSTSRKAQQQQMQNITGSCKFCISYKALTRRNLKTDLLPLCVQFSSNQTPIANEKILLPLYLRSSQWELYLIPTDFYSTTSAAISEAWFETTQVIQCSAIWFPCGLKEAWSACTVICSRILTRKFTVQKTYNINHYFRPEPQKK